MNVLPPLPTSGAYWPLMDGDGPKVTLPVAYVVAPALWLGIAALGSTLGIAMFVGGDVLPSVSIGAITLVATTLWGRATIAMHRACRARARRR